MPFTFDILMFKIITVGWQCEQFMERTLRSLEKQSVEDWQIQITYDPSTDQGADFIRQWCEDRDERWNYQINNERLFAPRNQYEGIRLLDPADDDVVVFLDLDGDQLAHSEVLAHLDIYYSDGTLLTYGTYQPVPPAVESPLVLPFPQEVVNTASYRIYMMTGPCCFNHLRTMSGKVANAISIEQLQWQAGPKTGQWYEGGTDYIFMIAGLELAGGRYKCIPEVLLLYNNANPNADNINHPAEADACVWDYFRRTPLMRIG